MIHVSVYLEVWEMRDLTVSLPPSHAFTTNIVPVHTYTDKVLWDIVQSLMEENITKVAITGGICCLSKIHIISDCCVLLDA